MQENCGGHGARQKRDHESSGDVASRRHTSILARQREAHQRRLPWRRRARPSASALAAWRALVDTHVEPKAGPLPTRAACCPPPPRTSVATVPIDPPGLTSGNGDSYGTASCEPRRTAARTIGLSASTLRRISARPHSPRSGAAPRARSWQWVGTRSDDRPRARVYDLPSFRQRCPNPANRPQIAHFCGVAIGSPSRDPKPPQIRTNGPAPAVGRQPPRRASHARGRRFETRRAHSEEIAGNRKVYSGGHPATNGS